MSDQDKGFLAGIFVSWIAMLLTVFAFTVLQSQGELEAPIPLCEEDEVYAWQHRPADYPSNITWECIAYDELYRIMER